MTVQELIDKLVLYDPDASVVIDTSDLSDFETVYHNITDIDDIDYDLVVIEVD